MALFEKGQPRPANAGRKKGSKNIKRIPKVADYLADKGINPAEEILRILEEDAKKDEADRKIGPFGRIEIMLDLLSYCQAKPKEIDDVIDDDESVFDDLSEDELLKIRELRLVKEAP